MEQAITKTTQLTEAEYSREKIDLIKQTVAIGVSDLELQLFLYTARRTGLDPLAKQIYAIRRWNSDAGREVMTVQTGIDGYRLIADRTGKLAGIDDPVFDTEDADHPNKATVTVRKMVDGQQCVFTASARWHEYVQLKKDKTPTAMWKKMPFLMLGKCAETLALRKAFPADLSGVYTFEEMSQASEEHPEQEKPQTSTLTVRGKVGKPSSTDKGIWFDVDGKHVFAPVDEAGHVNLPKGMAQGVEVELEISPAAKTKLGKEYHRLLNVLTVVEDEMTITTKDAEVA